MLRGLAILGGTALIEQFHCVLYLLGATLIVLAWRIWQGVGEQTDVENSLPVRMARRVKKDASPLILAVISMVIADIAFAVDSIPAAFAITDDAFVIWTANAFALLGLRALFVLVDQLVQRFRYLSQTIAAVLAIIGVKLPDRGHRPHRRRGQPGHRRPVLHGRHRRVGLAEKRDEVEELSAGRLHERMTRSPVSAASGAAIRPRPQRTSRRRRRRARASPTPSRRCSVTIRARHRGQQKGHYVNQSATVDRDTFRMVKRDGFEYDVYGTDKDRIVVRLPAKTKVLLRPAAHQLPSC